MKDKCFICEEYGMLKPDNTGSHCGPVCPDCMVVLKVVAKKKYKTDYQRYEVVLNKKLALAERIHFQKTVQAVA